MALRDHLEKLGYFQRLSAYKSINEGAAAMGISQAGLSKSIATLESILETQLFIRTRDGLILTKEGKLVLDAAKTIFKEAHELEANLRSIKAAVVPDRLTIGMYDSIAVYFFSDLTNYIESIYPTVQLSLVVDTSAQLRDAISSNSIDLAIGVGFETTQLESSNFYPLFDDQYSFYVSPKQSENVAELPLIIHPHASDKDGISVEDHLAKLISRKGAHRVFNFETLKTLASQGIGIGVLPTQVAKPLVREGQLVACQIPQVKHLFGNHHIGFLATSRFLKKHQDFAEDIYRLGQRWVKA